MIERGVLLRNTIIWVGAVGWVVWSYLIQDPAPDPWAAATRNGFTMTITGVVLVVSSILVIAWVKALRGRREAAPGEDPGAATH